MMEISYEQVKDRMGRSAAAEGNAAYLSVIPRMEGSRQHHVQNSFHVNRYAKENWRYRVWDAFGVDGNRRDLHLVW